MDTSRSSVQLPGTPSKTPFRSHENHVSTLSPVPPFVHRKWVCPQLEGREGRRGAGVEVEVWDGRTGSVWVILRGKERPENLRRVANSGLVDDSQ